ncbi:MAG: DEAD/DEAH box helicase [Alsobacter sp.]
MHELRPYQRAAIDAVFEYWATEGGSPLIDLATGVGKSVVIATLLRELYERYPHMRVLVLVHVRELVQQDYQALVRAWPSAPAGINSAGLGRRDLRHPILFASIQSVHRYAHAMGRRDLVLIDEAHLVPKAGDGMYQALFKDMRSINPDLRVFGCTATPYRLDSGRLDRGKDRFFDKTVYSYGIGEGVRDGFLSPLISKGMATEIDVSAVTRRGGEFVPGALEQAADRDEVTRAAVDELVQYGADRRSWLVFCSGLEHAEHVAQEIRSRGISVAIVTGKTPKAERAATLEAFKAGRIRCITNVSVLTTGFDAPAVDLVALLRPTLSTGLYVQMLGRGTRLAPGKKNCLVLDFSGNVRRHGPVDHVRVQSSGGGRGEGEASTGIESVRAKPCLHCMTYSPIQARECAECGTPFVDTPKHQARADTAPVLSGKVNDGWEDVSDVSVYRHVKRSGEGLPTMRVEYGCGVGTYREWLAFEHEGHGARKAASWWLGRGGKLPIPASVDEAIRRFNARELREIIAVRVENDGEFDRVTAWRCVERATDLFGEVA